MSNKKKEDSSLRVCYVCILLNPRLKVGREKRLYLLRGRGGILLHFFVFSFLFFPTRKQDEDYSIFSYRCLERFARYLHFLWNTISFRPNKSRFSFPSSREGGGGRGGGLSRNSGTELFSTRIRRNGSELLEHGARDRQIESSRS